MRRPSRDKEVRNTRLCPGCHEWIEMSIRRSVQSFEKHKSACCPDVCKKQKLIIAQMTMATAGGGWGD